MEKERIREIIEAVIKKLVVRNGKIKRVKTSSSLNKVVDSSGHEHTRSMSDVKRISRIQKKAAKKRRATEFRATIKRARSMKKAKVL